MNTIPCQTTQVWYPRWIVKTSYLRFVWAGKQETVLLLMSKYRSSAPIIFLDIRHMTHSKPCTHLFLVTKCEISARYDYLALFFVKFIYSFGWDTTFWHIDTTFRHRKKANTYHCLKFLLPSNNILLIT